MNEQMTAHMWAMHLGCECETPQGNGIVFGIYLDGTMEVRDEDGNWIGAYGLDECKPILTPLSEMTEGDALTFIQIGHDHSTNLISVHSGYVYWSIRYSDKGRWFKRSTLLGRTSGHSAEQFAFLLSKGYDVFNLAPRGVAKKP